MQNEREMENGDDIVREKNLKLALKLACIYLVET